MCTLTKYETLATHWVKITKDPETASTKAESLDEFITKREIPHIDFLKIDVEGHDADVLEGADHLLKEHRVTVLKFEYGTLWSGDQKPHRLLSQVISKLDNYSYACYFEGKNAFLKLTQSCWSETLETRFWSNVFCFSLKSTRGTALAHAFDAMSLSFW